MKKIYIGCDNAGMGLKKAIVDFLKAEGVAFEDIGVDSDQDLTMYPLVAELVAQKIIASDDQAEGILICGTGIGMAISANKFPGIYAAVCHDVYSAERARLSNNTNVMTLGARVIGAELAIRLVKEWLQLVFIPGSSSPKLEEIKDLEKRNFAQHLPTE